MSVYDRHRSLYVPISFNYTEDFSRLRYPGYIMLALVTDGKSVVSINGRTDTLLAPCAVWLSAKDEVTVIDNKKLFAQSFNLELAYLRARKSFKAHKTGSPLLDTYSGVFNLPPDVYIRIHEWMAVIGSELIAQSDSRWTCRVRAYFIRIINLLDEIKDGTYTESDTHRSYVDDILEYLHTHYTEPITLDFLCRRTHTNRTTLNTNFKARTGQTVIAYLLDYRLRVATELLAHTGLTVSEIANAAGFSCDTYLIKQFTLKNGKTPTEYRTEARRKYCITVDKSI